MMRPLVAPLALLLFGAYVVASVFGGFWGSHGTVTPTYYGNWTSWVTGRTNRAEYERFHSWRVANQQELVRLIRADGGERTLFVWGEYPWLYALLEARNPTRFATSYQTALLPGAKVETVRDLERTPPRYIVQEREEWRRLPGLTALLERRYEALAFVDNTVLWRLRE